MKRDSYIFLAAFFFLLVASVFLILEKVLHSIVFIALALGTVSYKRSNGIVIAAAGLIFLVMIVQYEEMAWYVGLAIMACGICFSFFEMWRSKKNIQNTFLETHPGDKEIKISFAWDPSLVFRARDLFGTYFNPSKRAVKIAVGGKEKLYFYDLSENEFYEITGEIHHPSLFGIAVGSAFLVIAVILLFFASKIVIFVKNSDFLLLTAFITLIVSATSLIIVAATLIYCTISGKR